MVACLGFFDRGSADSNQSGSATYESHLLRERLRQALVNCYSGAPGYLGPVAKVHADVLKFAKRTGKDPLQGRKGQTQGEICYVWLRKYQIAH